ncbi:MAG: HhH-GPD-type base excision DNA repair protein [Acidimicrobiales bacterium]
MPALHLSQNKEADRLLSTEPLALVIGMVLDQQVPLEWAFSAPLALKERLGALDAAAIAGMDPEALVAAFCQRPALHRFPAANARRVQKMCQLVEDTYSGRAANIWKKAVTGDELLRRVRALPGFGEQKARIFVGLLGKQMGVRPPGWAEAAGPFGHAGTYVSVADIVDEASLGKVRSHKQEMKARARAAAAEAAGSPA